ncbi:YbdK family carboxylate-amine ligase [Nonomuraea sp. FMUSA5-5]|uniref:Putative glutamate--cysteine ligase 2 n=1 Tax=Nonomuraea composti TaxID=2720023 RepID=A0ABX1B9Z1_9ACTN|nr:YbdK family carboxylate-amine ligase [Nonomuraea sp. FMUSA5-5]NJP94615.1 YbdK family carboxylate-amine ligase [Nonomuraea sp. FMUSA5-5]
MRTRGRFTITGRRSGPGAPTVGVEEEFLLLDRTDGRPACRAPELLALLGGHPQAKPELMRFQVETITGVCTDLQQVREELARNRRLVAGAAAEVGCHLAATGIAPRPGPGLAAITADPRYHELAARYRSLVARSGTCGLHVHVGVPSREAGVLLLARLRPYLPTLLALSGNSPVVSGRDTGWASRRYLECVRWPSARPPNVWRSADAYDAAVQRLIRAGRALDARSVYFHARLSPRYPTVEVRIADSCLSVDDAVAVAALVRALTVLAFDDIGRGTPMRRVSGRRIAAELGAAARDGLAARAADPYTGRSLPHRALLAALLDHLAEPEPVARSLAPVLTRGTGADRQRALWRRAATPGHFAALLAEATLAATLHPVPPGG